MTKLSVETLGLYFKLTQTTARSECSLLELKHRVRMHNQTFAFSTSVSNLANENLVLDENDLAQYLLTNQFGFCFHHNITFYNILESLGYEVKLVSGHFGGLEQISTHPIMIVTIDGSEYLVDVGMGQRITQVLPLPISVDSPTIMEDYHVTLLADGSYFLEFKEEPAYVFQNKSTSLENFEAGSIIVKSASHLFHTMFLYTIRNENEDINRVYIAANEGRIRQDIELPEKQKQQLLVGAFSNEKLEEIIKYSGVIASQHYGFFPSDGYDDPRRSSYLKDYASSNQ